jgi:HAD superfamily hydrolase (TIGR01509 family)
MAIVTSSLRSHFDVIHKTRPLEKYFDFVLTREDYKKSKPHPEPYETAVRRFGLPVEHCIAIEDTERGMKSAQAAGLRCIIVPNEFTRGCPFEGAVAVLESIHRLPALLRTL